MGRWNIARVDDVHVVTMTANKVNAMNGGFFDDLPLAVMRYTLSPAHAREVALFGRLYAPAEALARGLVDEVVPSAEVITRAVAVARSIAPDSLTAYATLKGHLLAPALAAYAARREQVNREFLDVWFSEGGRRRISEVRDRLMRRS